MKFQQLACRVSLSAIAALSLAGTAAAADGVPSNRGVGVNLSSFDYYSPDFPVINQLKRAGGWLTQCTYPRDAYCKNFGQGQSAWDTLEQAKLKLDENGYPTSLPAATDPNTKYRFVSALMFHADSKSHPAGKYIVTYEGEGKLEYGLAGTKVAGESKPGRDVVNVTNTDSNGLLLSIAATTPGNHIRNIRVLPPGGVCSLDKSVFALTSADCTAKGLGTLVTFENLNGRHFHPQFVADLKGFRTLRFLDWNRTNTSTLAHWADRPRMADAMWSGNAGVPVNAMVLLANEVGADPWINLPTHATDDYARSWARQVKNTLAPKLTVHVEYSNEMWNYSFNQAHWARDQAAAKWPEQIAKGVSPYTLQPSWYGMRAAQLCKVVKAEFGAEAHRVKCELNMQSGFVYMNQQTLDCPYAATEMGGACHKFLDGVAIAPYFGNYIAYTDKTTRDIVKTWYSQPDGGVAKLFEEVLAQNANGAKVTPPLYGKAEESHIDGSIGRAKTSMMASHKEATSRGLPVVAYEGGQHLVMAWDDNDQQFLNLITNANRDARMGTAYSRLLTEWQAMGGQAFTVYNHVYKPGRYGFWGLKETQSDNANPKWKAVLPYRDTKNCWWANCTR
jgi:hypothetical protein